MRLRGLTVGVGLAISCGFLACEGSDEIDTRTGTATGRGEGAQPPAPPGAPPTTCDRDCITRAREAFVACTQVPGADQEACRRTYIAAGEACGCVQPPPTRPPATCDQACATRAREAFVACTQAPGADQRACRATLGSALEACGCARPAPTPPPPASCDMACATRARAAFDTCSRAPGADQRACRATFTRALEVCGCQPSGGPPPPGGTPPPPPGGR